MHSKVVRLKKLPSVPGKFVQRGRPIVEIGDVQEAFCGCRRKYMVPLCDAEPEIAEEWLYAKNAGWGPADLSRGSAVRCWWECRFCLRPYKAQIVSRTRPTQRSACPYCASKRVCEDNSLVDNYPEVAAEWHPTKNKKLKATEVMRASAKQVWWLCKTCQCSWEAKISDRTTLHSGCPHCYEARMQYAREHPQITIQPQVVVGEATEISRKWYENDHHNFDSLAKKCPKIAKQWHPTKNGDWKPKDFAKGSDAIVWWKCNAGSDHVWQAAIYSRTGPSSRGCPYCAGKKVSVTNSIRTQAPELSRQWHPEKNGNLTPEQFTTGSNAKMWWQCLVNGKHEWTASIKLRSNGSGCPYCSHAKVSDANSLAIKFPLVAAQLHPTKNGDTKAEEIAEKSIRKFWWKCDRGADHEWQATAANRTFNGSNCPFCAGTRVSITTCLAVTNVAAAKQWDQRKNGLLTPYDVTAGSKKRVWWRCAKGHSWEQAVNKRVVSTVECWPCLGKNKPGKAVTASSSTKGRK